MMFRSFWHRLRDWKPGRQGRSRPRSTLPHTPRPRLEPLEDRVLPSLLPAPALSAGPHPTAAPVAHREEAAPPPACAHAMKVTVAENSPARVVDLDAVFAGMSGIQHDTGLHLAMLGNTNSRLVATDLSGADLTLSFARWKSGTATITVGATDADGVSVREVLLVTVFPRGAAAPGTTTHTPAAARPSTPATP